MLLFFPSKCGCFEAKTGHCFSRALLLFRNYLCFFFLFFFQAINSLLWKYDNICETDKACLKSEMIRCHVTKSVSEADRQSFYVTLFFCFFFVSFMYLFFSIFASSPAMPFACVAPRKMGRMLAACFVNRDILSRKSEQRTSTRTRPRSCVLPFMTNLR